MVKIFHLPNGITGVVDERPSTGKVVVQIGVRRGSVDEADHEAGLTMLAMEASAGGTKTRSREQIADDVETRGGSFGVSTARTASEARSASLYLRVLYRKSNSERYRCRWASETCR